MYQLPDDYVKGEEQIIREMTLDQLKALAIKYIDPAKMYFVVAGDAKTQIKPLEKLGLGKPILVGK
jgi:zinc protease